MGKANRQRRRAKEKERKRRHQQAGPDGPPQGHPWRADFWQATTRQPAPRELAEQLISDAVHARFHSDEPTFRRCAALLTERPDITGWRRVADRALMTCLQRSVRAAWHRGWQPADVVRLVGRESGKGHARMAADAIAAEMRGYAAATVDERWEAQLTALDARVWWEHDDRYLQEWCDRAGVDHGAAITCALDVLAVLSGLPELARLGPLPGKARRVVRDAGRSAESAADQRMLSRVRALLAKAESTEFPEEAEALTARAQQLMSRHSIDDAMLAAEAGARTDPSGRRLGVDNPYEAPKAALLDVVAGANRCRAVWHRHLGFCTVLGFPSDLDAVEMLFTSLLVQATTAMVHAGSRRDAHGRSRTRSFRQAFLSAYAQRIGERLRAATDEATRAAVAASAERDLLPVLAARDRAVDQAVDAMFPELTQRAVRTVSNHEGWLAGRAAADRATLHARSEVTGDSRA